MTRAEFELLAEITSCGAEPAMSLNDLAGESVTTGATLRTVEALKRAGFVKVTPFIDGDSVVIVTAKGLRAFGEENGSDPGDVEAAIKDLDLE